MTRAVSAARRSIETAAADDLLRLSSNSQSAMRDFVRVTRARRAALRDRTLALVELPTQAEREEERNDDVGLQIPKRGRPPKEHVVVLSTPEKKSERAKVDAKYRTAARENLETASPFKPRRISEVKDVVFIVGETTYDTRARAEADIKAAAERDKKRITFSKGPNGKGNKDVNVLHALCPVSGCKFCLRFRHANGCFRCTTSEPHTCTTLPTYGEKRNFHNYTAMELASALDDDLEKDPHLKPASAVATLQKYVNKAVTNDFAGKVLSFTKKRRRGGSSTGQGWGKLIAYAQIVNESGIGSMVIHTCDAREMKQIYTNRLKQEHANAEKDLPEAKKTKFKPPDTSFITDEGGPFYTGFTYVPAASKALWEAGLLERTPSTSDGCHTEADECGGTFFCTNTYDANRHLIPLLVEHWIFNEDEQRWTSHFSKLKKEYTGIDTPLHANISDQDKGLEAGRRKTCPSMLGFHCCDHRQPHVRKHAGKEAADLYETAVHAYTERHLDYVLKQMSPKAHAYVDKVDAAEQYMRSAFLAGASLRNYSTSQGAESFNSKLTRVHVRHVPIEQAMANLVETLRDDVVKRYENAAKCTDAAPPRIRVMLNTGGEKNQLVENHVCTWQGNASAQRTIAHVHHKDYPSRYTVVNIKDATCSCGRPEIVQGPFCVCLATAANSAGVDLCDKLQVMDTTTRWRQQCDVAYQTISTIKMPCTKQLDFVDLSPLQPPAAAPRPRGRPRNPDRKKSALEMVLGKNQCAVCKQYGHKAGSRKCSKFNLTRHGDAAPLP